MKVLILDDEKHCSEILKWELERSCSEINEITTYNDPLGALKALKSNKYDLIFLDIEMPGMNGFEVLENLGEQAPKVIFTTAYDQFAIKAIRFSAMDYLLKPINKEDLIRAVQRASETTSSDFNQHHLLLNQIRKSNAQISKIALPTLEGLDLVEINEIYYCSASSNYTEIYFQNNEMKLVSRTMKDIGEMLFDHNFVRVHHSHIVNLNHVDRYIKGAGGYVQLNNKVTVNVSKSYKEKLIDRLKKLY